MNLQERDTLQAEMQASEAYTHRMYSFDPINDDPDNRAVNLVAHCAPRQNKESKRAQETKALAEFAEGVLGRELADNEIVIRAIEAPAQTSAKGRF